MRTINSQQLEALVHNDAIRSIAVDGTVGGFIISVNNGITVEAKRGHTRVFKKLQAAATFLKNRGIGSFQVDVSKWEPDQNSLT